MLRFIIKNSKKLFLTGLIVILTLSLCACGKASVSQAQYEKDIIAREEVQKCFLSEYVTNSNYELIASSVTKRQIDKDKNEDKIYCDVEIANEYFHVNLSVLMKYYFYDKNGWVLEKFEIIDKTVVPIGVANEDAVFNAVSDNLIDEIYEGRTAVLCLFNDEFKTLRHGRLTKVGSEFDSENQQMKLNVCYKSDVIEVNGYYLLDFDSRDGWSLHPVYDDAEYITDVMHISSYTADYSAALGSFSTIANGSMNISKYDLNITEITDNTISYSVDVEGFDTYYTYADSDVLQEIFDPLTGTFSLNSGEYSVSGTTMDFPLGNYFYNSIDDRWDSSSGPDYPNSWSSNQYFTPRTLGRNN